MLPPPQKKAVYDQRALVVLTYGAETWVLMMHLERKLRAIHRPTERKMVCVFV